MKSRGNGLVMMFLVFAVGAVLGYLYLMNSGSLSPIVPVADTTGLEGSSYYVSTASTTLSGSEIDVDGYQEDAVYTWKIPASSINGSVTSGTITFTVSQLLPVGAVSNDYSDNRKIGFGFTQDVSFEHDGTGDKEDLINYDNSTVNGDEGYVMHRFSADSTSYNVTMIVEFNPDGLVVYDFEDIDDKKNTDLKAALTSGLRHNIVVEVYDES